MSEAAKGALNGAEQKPYPEINPQARYPEIEARVLAKWKAQNTFAKSIDQHKKSSDGGAEFVFYDGPPFANGLPHYGHLLTGYVKDIVPRYQTMRGKRVERRFGWDCHGLPAEMEAEKELKISGRTQIQNYGIDKFNDYCRNSVLRYTSEWESYVTRQARWVDFKNDYKTMDLPYMESVMWAFKQLWDKGLIYEGNRVLPYSWACETPLSNFEIRLDNATRPRQDPAVTVAFSLIGEAIPTRILVWTTTPWTLPSNLGLAVGKEISYAVLEKEGARLIIAEAAVAKYAEELKGYEKVETRLGSSLVGKKYTPLFPYFAETPNAFVVMAGEFVATEEGTGTVHMAPGFGEDDQTLCDKNKIPLVCPVDDSGKFTSEVPDFQGLQVFDANKPIIKVLKERCILIRHETYVHNYPHCWRTDTPIIYRALSSWYVKVEAFKARMIELNKEISWIPEHIRDGQFGRWLENSRDWSISRNRFWGAPIPVWKSDDPTYPRVDAYGSIAELEKDFGVSLAGKKITDLHRPFIDSLTRANPDDPTGKSTMRRVTEVLDCWFESGSMPFAQIHYPFENKEWFEGHFPADFIVEYIAQTRGWFYTLMVLGTALFDKPPFKRCICHGIVLDGEGQKLSKRLKNYPSPEEVFSTYGADALRWFLVSSPILRGLNLHIDKEGKAIGEVVRTVLNPIWNGYYFFTLYANADQITAKQIHTTTNVLDRYVLSKLKQCGDQVTKALDGCELAEACEAVRVFIDALNNWYIRRSRERFWKKEKDSDKQAAYDTLYTVLVTLSTLAAPMLPMICEEVYCGLTGKESVHLASWPDLSSLPADAELVSAMDLIREVCSVGLSLREKHNLRTRLPLQKVTIAGKQVRALEQFTSLIRDELNVKEVVLAEDFSALASYKLQINSRVLGPRLGERMKEILKSAKEGKWALNSAGVVEVLGEPLKSEEYTLTLTPHAPDRAQALQAQNAVVVLDIEITQALKEEGQARDIVRAVQQARKDAGLQVTDRIQLALTLPVELERAAKLHQPYIAEQTLSGTIAFTGEIPAAASPYTTQFTVEEFNATLRLARL